MSRIAMRLKHDIEEMLADVDKAVIGLKALKKMVPLLATMVAETRKKGKKK